MDKKYQIEANDGIISVRFRHNPAAMDLIDALVETARIESGRLRLWDFGVGADFAHSDIKKIANHANSITLPCGKVAIVAPQDLTYGIFRMLTVYWEEKRVDLNVFRTEKAAIGWLKNGMPG